MKGDGMEFYVLDHRNTKVLLGPFDEKVAHKCVVDLNNFVLRNANITEAPFYYAPAYNVSK